MGYRGEFTASAVLTNRIVFRVSRLRNVNQFEK